MLILRRRRRLSVGRGGQRSVLSRCQRLTTLLQRRVQIVLRVGNLIRSRRDRRLLRRDLGLRTVQSRLGRNHRRPRRRRRGPGIGRQHQTQIGLGKSRISNRLTESRLLGGQRGIRLIEARLRRYLIETGVLLRIRRSGGRLTYRCLRRFGIECRRRIRVIDRHLRRIYLGLISLSAERHIGLGVVEGRLGCVDLNLRGHCVRRGGGVGAVERRLGLCNLSVVTHRSLTNRRLRLDHRLLRVRDLLPRLYRGKIQLTTLVGREPRPEQIDLGLRRHET